MKESSTSLRWYFGIIGLLGLLGSLALWGLASVISLATHMVDNSVTSFTLLVIGLLESVGLLYFAFALPKFLNPEKEKYVKWFLWGTLILGGIVGLLQVIFSHSWPDFVPDLTYLIPAALITWYLAHNVHKLSYTPATPELPKPPKKKGTVNTTLAVVIILVLIIVLYSLFVWYGNQ